VRPDNAFHRVAVSSREIDGHTGEPAVVGAASIGLAGQGSGMILAVAALAFLCMAAPDGVARAQRATGERLSLSLGVFVADRDTNTRIDAESGSPGTDVDLEQDLGLDSTDSVFRVDGYYKFSDRHRIDASWFDLSRSSTKVIDRDIEWNGTIYPIDTSVDSVIDLDIYKVAYTYSFLKRDKGFLGVSAGLYVADFATALDAPVLDRRESGDATAPLPVFGLRGEYRLSDRWTLRASGEFFLFEYGDWDGSLYDVYAGIDYRFTEHFAVGAALNAVDFDIGVEKQNLAGNLDWGYAGGLLFLKISY